jgi:hypothetical protein
MLSAERRLFDGKGSLVERLRLGVAAPSAIVDSEVAQRRSNVQVLVARRLLGYCERALEERLGLGVASLQLVERGKVVECGGNV